MTATRREIKSKLSQDALKILTANENILRFPRVVRSLF